MPQPREVREGQRDRRWEREREGRGSSRQLTAISCFPFLARQLEQVPCFGLCRVRPPRKGVGPESQIFLNSYLSNRELRPSPPTGPGS